MLKQILGYKSFLKIKRARRLVQGFSFRKILLFSYIFGILLGFFLAVLSIFLPFLSTCFSLFGERFCTSTGVLLVLFISLPGYLLVGNLFSLLAQIPWVLSFLAVILFSGVFYFLMGLFIDKIRMKKPSTEVATKYLVYISFIFLVILLLLLLSQKNLWKR